jgi:hypothetical protein
MKCKEYDTLMLMSYVCDDLDVCTAECIKNHLQQCATCRDVVMQLQNERETFLQLYPKPVVPHMPVRAKTVAFRTRTLVAMAASLILIASTGYVVVNLNKGDGYRIKGTTQLDLYVQDENGASVKSDRRDFYPGDKIQFSYSSGANRYFMLLSIDTSSSVTFYYPSEGDSSMEIIPGQQCPLPNSIVLDDYIGPELYLAVFTAFPLHTAYVKEQILGSLSNIRELGLSQPEIRNAEVRTVYITKKEHRQ